MRLFNQDTKVQALKRAPLFEGPLAQGADPARAGKDLEVPAGEVLCREGETGQEFFVITPAVPLDDTELDDQQH